MKDVASRPLLAAALAVCGCAQPVDLGTAEAALTPPTSIASQLATDPLPNYDDAPRTPDADDPSIFVDAVHPERSLVIATLKDAGLAVFDLAGSLVQVLPPPNRPALLPTDPPVPGQAPADATSACPESESGETFGRFNNVDIVQDYPLRGRFGVRFVDLAVVTDRGCDRLRVYAIEPGRPGGPLFDVTVPAAERVFPRRYVQPWEGAADPFVEQNPLDDQSTAYGITLAAELGTLRAFVTQRSRTAVAELELYDAGRGRVGYRRVRELRFPARYTLRDGADLFAWTPCREDAADDPQLEGLVADVRHGALYASQEVVGIWKIPLASLRGSVVYVDPRHLIEPVRSFGEPYWAVPDDDEFSCEDEQPEELPAGTVVQRGTDAYRGPRVTADAEGLAIYEGPFGSGHLIASSQGDDTFHVFARRGGFTRATANRFQASFTVEGAGETDGHEVTAVALGRAFPDGLFVLQSGKAPAPADESPIGGYDYDGASQFLYVDWADIAATLPGWR